MIRFSFCDLTAIGLIILRIPYNWNWLITSHTNFYLYQIQYMIVLAVVVGIIAGPLCANVIDPFHWTDMDIFTRELTRVTIAIQVWSVITLLNPVCFSRCIYLFFKKKKLIQHVEWLHYSLGYGCWYLTATVSTISTIQVMPLQCCFNFSSIIIISRYMWCEFRSMFMLLIPVMSYMWIVSAAAIYLLVPPLTFVSALYIFLTSQ